MRPIRHLKHVITLLVLVVPIHVHAVVRLPAILSDHMMLQAAQSISIWGWADPKEKVSVRLGGATRSATAGADGRWRVSFAPLAASSSPVEMVVSGHANTITVRDVLIGEVWLASGQSNMEMSFNSPHTRGIFDFQAERAAVDNPSIRVFKVKQNRRALETADTEGKWIVCTPPHVTDTGFSAAGYFFARRLQQTLNVPIGLVDSTWGGTRIEEWVSSDGFRSQKSLARFLETEPEGTHVDGVKRSGLFNGMIAPLSPLSLKGIIWYQGESNASDVRGVNDYAAKMRALIDGWRLAFRSNLPFYYVQIAPYLYHVERPLRVVSPEAAPRVQEAQTDVLSTQGTGMVVVNDLVDDLFDIHPRNKKDVGERLAGLALAQTYGQSHIAHSGPRFKAVSFERDKAIISFEFAGRGLQSRDQKPLTWFTIAGTDGVYYPGAAEINGDRVIVSSPLVSAPVAVRFAWDEAARPNLVNSEGLPAGPFRSQRDSSGAQTSVETRQ